MWQFFIFGLFCFVAKGDLETPKVRGSNNGETLQVYKMQTMCGYGKGNCVVTDAGDITCKHWNFVYGDKSKPSEPLPGFTYPTTEAPENDEYVGITCSSYRNVMCGLLKSGKFKCFINDKFIHELPTYTDGYISAQSGKFVFIEVQDYLFGLSAIRDDGKMETNGTMRVQIESVIANRNKLYKDKGRLVMPHAGNTIVQSAGAGYHGFAVILESNGTMYTYPQWIEGKLDGMKARTGIKSFMQSDNEVCNLLADGKYHCFSNSDWKSKVFTPKANTKYIDGGCTASDTVCMLKDDGSLDCFFANFLTKNTHNKTLSAHGQIDITPWDWSPKDTTAKFVQCACAIQSLCCVTDKRVVECRGKGKITIPPPPAPKVRPPQGVNPCETNNGGCASDATCSNNGGSATCTCSPPYTTNSDGKTCGMAVTFIKDDWQCWQYAGVAGGLASPEMCAKKMVEDQRLNYDCDPMFMWTPARANHPSVCSCMPRRPNGLTWTADATKGIKEHKYPIEEGSDLTGKIGGYTIGCAYGQSTMYQITNPPTIPTDIPSIIRGRILCENIKTIGHYKTVKECQTYIEDSVQNCDPILSASWNDASYAQYYTCSCVNKRTSGVYTPDSLLGIKEQNTEAFKVNNKIATCKDDNSPQTLYRMTGEAYPIPEPSTLGGMMLKNLYPNHCVSPKEAVSKYLGKGLTQEQCKDKALADSTCWQENGMVQIFTFSGGVNLGMCYCSKYRNPTKTHSSFDYGPWYNQATTCMINRFYGNSCTLDSDCDAVEAEGNYQCSNGVCNPCEVCDTVPTDCETIIAAQGKCGCAYCGDSTPRKVGSNWAPVGWQNAIKYSRTAITTQQCYEAVQIDSKCEPESDGRYVFFINHSGNLWFCVCNTNKASDFGTSKPFRWMNGWIKDDIYSGKPAAELNIETQAETEIGSALFKNSITSFSMFLIPAIVMVVGYFAGRNQGQKVAQNYAPLVSMATYQSTQE